MCQPRRAGRRHHAPQLLPADQAEPSALAKVGRVQLDVFVCPVAVALLFSSIWIDAE